MKLKFPGFALSALLILFSCDDTTDKIGWEIMPMEDMAASYTTTFDVMSETVRADSVYARTQTAYLGRFSDPEFGYYDASFMTEMTTPENYKFPAVYKYDANTKTGSGTMAGDSCVSIFLRVSYSKNTSSVKGFFGDSITACRVSAYELNDQWLADRKSNGRFYRYTNIDVNKYYDKNKPIGSTAYTAHDYSVSSSSSSENYIDIKLDKEMGNKILKMNREHPEYFADGETLTKNVIPGYYLESDYGDGTIIYVNRLILYMGFNFYATDSLGVAVKKKVTDEKGAAGTDSTYYAVEYIFSSTPEVIQANKFTHSDKLQEKIDDPDNTYIKSPAGVFTALTVPYDEIYQSLGNDTLNAVKLSLTNYVDASTYKYAMDKPSKVLLIRKKDMKEFFENNSLPNNTTSFYVQHNATETNKYVFKNIANLIKITMAEKQKEKEKAGSAWNSQREANWVEENKLLVIPVVVDIYSQQSSYGSSTDIVVGTTHDLKPCYARLVGGKGTTNGKLNNPIKLEVTYTRFGE
ncbi:MAG: DUF4270 domain-containing protein [Bacteroidaceae bacterium]|nr:DUF4270 domain-containing protein [Bacteroidaceae bacterium]